VCDSSDSVREHVAVPTAELKTGYRTAFPHVSREGEGSMDAFWIMDHLDTKPQPPLNGFDEAVAFIATPVFKQFLGIELPFRTSRPEYPRISFSPRMTLVNGRLGA
jgi:hypothetical protein